jgi:uncharacterized membrane protein
MTKSMILPILAVLALLVKTVFHIDIPSDTLDNIAQAIIAVTLVVVNIHGIIKNHKKEAGK